MAIQTRASILEYFETVEGFIKFHEQKARWLEVDKEAAAKTSQHGNIFQPVIYSMSINNRGIEKLLKDFADNLQKEIDQQLKREYYLIEEGKKMQLGLVQEIDLNPKL